MNLVTVVPGVILDPSFKIPQKCIPFCAGLPSPHSGKMGRFSVIRHGFSTGLVPAEPGFMGGVEMRAGLKYFAVFSEQVPPSVESGCACPRFLPKKGGSCRSPAEGTPGLEGEWQGSCSGGQRRFTLLED